MTPRADRPNYAGMSDVGRVRSHNEDAVLLSPPLFAVADGLGGHRAGEIASKIAIEALMEAAPARPDAKALGRAVRAANGAVIDAAHDGRGRDGMGTTLTAAIVEGNRIALAHVGDSRAYLFHRGKLEPITEDHSMVADLLRDGQITPEEARVHPNRSVITRALGSDMNMYADTYEVDTEPGDRLLICSDGLTSMLTDQHIEDILESVRDPESAVRSLVDAANAAGGHDNISVALVDTPDEEGALSVGRARRRGRFGAAVWVFALLAIVAAAWFGVVRYAQGQAYLVAEDGVVVLYRGLPGSLAGLELSWVEETTSISVRDLEPVTAARLAQGIAVDGVTDGRRVIDGYRSAAATDSSTPSSDTAAP